MSTASVPSIENIMHNPLAVPSLTLLLLMAVPSLSPAVESKAIRAYAVGSAEPYSSFSGITRRAWKCGFGTTTYLECRQISEKEQHHDIDHGRTELVLRSKKTNTVLRRVVLRELWDCISFNKKTGNYLLGSVHEYGQTDMLCGLVYLNERRKTFRDTVYRKKGFMAFESLASKDGRYLVFVAWGDMPPIGGMFVLNTDLDQYRYLGDPPSPPPIPTDENYPGREITWSWFWQDYLPPEPGLFAYPAADTLRVGFGDDTISARSPHREYQEWDLKTLFQQPQQPVSTFWGIRK